MQLADYSGGRPSGRQLLAAGFGGVVRYIGLGSAGKRLTAGEYRDLTAAGLDVHLVAELGTGDSWGSSSDDDYARGRANAAAALADARVCGVRDPVIFGASDAHSSAQWQIDDTVDYIRGFRDVLGAARTGHYGFADTQTAVRRAGVATGFWRCGSEPSKADKQWVHLWQRNKAPTTRVVGGVVCDINDQYRPLIAAPDDNNAGETPASQEDDMPDRELLPTANNGAAQRSVTLVVSKSATELIVSRGWALMWIVKIAAFGPAPADGTTTLDVADYSKAPFRVDPARPYRFPLADARAKGELLTVELTYAMAPSPADKPEAPATAGFR